MQTAPPTTIAQAPGSVIQEPAAAPLALKKTLPVWIDWSILAAAALVLLLAWRKRIIGPRAFERVGLRDVSFQPPAIWFAAALLVLFSTVLLAALAQITIAPPPPPDQPQTAKGAAAPMLAVYLFAGAACLVLARVLWLVPRRDGRVPATISLHWPDTLRGIFWFLGCIPVVLASAIIATLLHGLITGHPPDPVAHDTLKLLSEQRADPWMLGLVLGAVVGAPLVEEHLYRAFLQSGLLAATRHSAAAITITALLFSLIHSSSVPPHALLPLFVLGLALGLAYERTRSLIVPITMHSLFNAGNIALALLLT